LTAIMYCAFALLVTHKASESFDHDAQHTIGDHGDSKWYRGADGVYVVAN
jgi:hypothetical protein